MNESWDLMSYRIFAHSLKPVTNAVKQVVEMIAVLIIIEMIARFAQTISLIVA